MKRNESQPILDFDAAPKQPRAFRNDTQTLLELAKDGDLRAIEVLWRQHGEITSGVIGRFGKDKQACDDLKTDAYLAFCHAVKKWPGAGRFNGFYATVLYRRMLELHRDRRVHKLEFTQYADDPIENDDNLDPNLNRAIAHDPWPQVNAMLDEELNTRKL